MAAVRRVYGGFRGVDFRGEEVSLQRSPDSVNMWRSYKTAQGICTRPGLRRHRAFTEPVYGIYGCGSDLLVHSGEKLYRVTENETLLLGEGLKAGSHRIAARKHRQRTECVDLARKHFHLRSRKREFLLSGSRKCI